MTRRKLTQIEKQRAIIRQALARKYNTTKAKAETLFIESWIGSMLDRDLAPADMKLLLEYLWTKDDTDIDLNQDKKIEIILPDYDLRKEKDEN